MALSRDYRMSRRKPGAAQCKPILRALSALWLAFSPLAAAHDFWIEPMNFRPKPGDKVPLQLRVGQHFKGEAVLFLPEAFERYLSASGDGEQSVAGKRGDEPAGSIVAGRGLHVIGLHSKQFEVSFESLPEFQKYLETEGLERNLALADKRWKLRRGVLELYERCAKSFVRAGDLSAPWSDHVFGFPLELIAESDPHRGNELRLQLRYRGKPLEGALVVAFNKAQPQDKLKARTDKEGRVALALAQPGVWLVTAVHMIPAPLLSRADWESFWASLTFARP
jgi:hypothetical protein